MGVIRGPRESGRHSRHAPSAGKRVVAATRPLGIWLVCRTWWRIPAHRRPSVDDGVATASTVLC